MRSCFRAPLRLPCHDPDESESVRTLTPAAVHAASCLGLALRVPRRPPGSTPAEAQSLRLSAAVAAALGFCASWSVGTFRRRHACIDWSRSAPSRAYASLRTEHVQRCVRSLLANIPIARLCLRSFAPQLLIPRASVPSSSPLRSGRSSPHVVSRSCSSSFLLFVWSSRATAFLPHLLVFRSVLEKDSSVDPISLAK